MGASVPVTYTAAPMRTSCAREAILARPLFWMSAGETVTGGLNAVSGTHALGNRAGRVVDLLSERSLIGKHTA